MPTEDPLAATLAKLGPDAMRASFVRAGLFIAGWELLKNEVVNGVRGFFVTGFDEHGLTTDERYSAQVRCLHKKEFDACLMWLISAGGLTTTQAERVRVMRAHRNAIAHELPRFIMNPGTDVDLLLLRETREMVAELGRFWGSIEVNIDPRFDHVDVEHERIVSGTQLFMDHLIAAAEGL